MLRSFLPLSFAAAFTLASPVLAQEDAGDTVRMVILYGDDAAPVAEGDEIVVVARMPESERYRIPEGLRTSGNPANQSWASRVEKLEFVGNFGTLSCSAVGIGGSTGCTQELIREAYADKASAPSVRFGRLIEAARAERLANIDEDSAEEQARVEEIEREYMQRLDRNGGDESEATVDDGVVPPED